MTRRRDTGASRAGAVAPSLWRRRGDGGRAIARGSASGGGRTNERGGSEQKLCGAYTVADSWTFVEVLVRGLDEPMPTLDVNTSPEYSEKVEAAAIARILESIVALRRREASP